MRTATLIEPYLGYRNINSNREMGYQVGSGDLRKWQTYLGV